MATFLHDVAEYLLNRYSEKFRDCCVVFPSQRSSVYFCDELKRLNSKVIWLPKMFTIDEFIHKIGNLKVASPIAQYATLYQVYKELDDASTARKTDATEEKKKTGFDKFFPWAQVILADFNDIDKYLVNADALLRNIQEIKQLDSNIDYLTEEQRDAIKKFFNVVYTGESEMKKRFLDIWQKLLPMYEQLGKRLNENGLAYDGQVYRRAADIIGSTDYELPFEKVFFVGFNAVTRSEERVFSALKAQGKALFFWDYDQSYIDDRMNEAGRFLRNFVVEFAEPDDFKTCHNFGTDGQQITVVASPTVSGQMSVVAERLAQTPVDEMSDTALVLADETLLMGTIEHTAPYVSDMNVTMGYKLKNSVAGQWVEQLVQLQSNKHTTDSGTTFYYKNVVTLLQHPFFISASPDFAVEMTGRIKSEAIFQVPTDEFESDDFARTIFKPISTPHDFSAYVLGILKHLMNIWGQLPDDAENQWNIQQELVYKLILQIQQLDTELAGEQLEIEMPTYYQLLRKYVASLTVPFSGEPIKGLQVMGFLETRNLDFRNLIILNVNDGVLPVDGSSPTFIPFSLRRGFGLPTHEDREAMYAYYFYRLLQRAQNVTLTYFVGNADGKRGEPSRYIMQLVYGGREVSQQVLRSDISFDAATPLTIVKDEGTMRQLSAYVADGRPINDVKRLSASAIVTYQKCPVMFYFSKVLGLDSDDDIDENIDARQFGNIFHKSICEIYKGFLGKAVTGDDIRALTDDFIVSKIDNAFVEEMFPKATAKRAKIESGECRLADELNGNNRMVYSVISEYVKLQINYDAATADKSPIEFIELEKEHNILLQIEVGGKKQKIKFGGFIDRIDHTNGETRVIDYKTGSNDVECNLLEDVFDPVNIKKYKGILQTLIYCLMFDHDNSKHEVLAPYLFKTTKLGSGESFKVRSKGSGTGKNKVTDEFDDGNYMRVADRVREFMQQTLTSIFDAETPFVQTEDENQCAHCNFSYLCNKQAKIEYD
jgi:hypothetical protein